MTVILLSGGSGKRLWPLSNDIRSKQFIPFYKNEKGEYESMIQRIFRQIYDTMPYANIVIAANESQVSAIKNQLGEKVKICVEPCRKDTFPAIALAGAYLNDKLEFDYNECMAVCPIDPFVENSFYEIVRETEKYITEYGSNLILIGIEPTYPSERYGYIIPESADKISNVIEFKEKPNKEVAQKYITQGALWNSGVFAFKLGYILSAAHKQIDFKSYDDLYLKYETLKKISFDYAVVEKEDNIKTVRYCGEWKDVGTWDTLTEVLPDTVKGNAYTDGNCSGVHIINELDIPILCVGCTDQIIAASSDGILISDKKSSGNIKNCVEKINGEIRFAEKSWGTYSVIDIQPNAMTVKIMMNAGGQMTYHSHMHRTEIWTVISGSGKIILDGKEQIIEKGQTVTIPVGCKHTLIANVPMSVIEVQIGGKIIGSDKKIHQKTFIKN